MANESYVDTREVISNMKNLTPKVKKALDVIGHQVGGQMETYAKDNAKWTDRTGAARGGLSYDCKWQGTVLDISIYHSVDYGLWLEVRNFPIAGRLAILQDARDSQVQDFLNMIKQLKL